MKKIVIPLIIMFFGAFQVIVQNNPVRNLSWEHRYVFPNNFYRLEWNKPSPSQDTLIGYKIYRDNELYRFQTDSILNHEEGNQGNDDGCFICYNNTSSFWMHVTAIYNHDSIESPYTDSAFCGGPMLDINKISINKINIYPNPTKGKVYFDIDKKINKIYLIDVNGKSIERYPKNNELDISTLKKGVYFVKIFIKNKTYTSRLIVE